MTALRLCVLLLSTAYFFAQAAAAQTVKTQWRYGEGICAGGWLGHPFAYCDDKSLPPLSKQRINDPRLCGVDVVEQRNKTCRLPEFGPKEILPESKISKTEVIRPSGSPEEHRNKCTAKANEVCLANGWQVLSATVPNMKHLEHRDSYGGLCHIEMAKMVFPERTDPRCGIIPRQETAKSCDWIVYQRTTRKECGYAPAGANLSRLFSKFPPYETDVKECLTADDLPDETPEQLVAKVKYLLSPVNVADQTAFMVITERRHALLAYFLKTRSADLSQDLIEQIWQLKSKAKIAAFPAGRVFKDDDISVFVDEVRHVASYNVVPQPNGDILQLLYVSLPKYADAASICMGTKEMCKQYDGLWHFMPLVRSDKDRYQYTRVFIQRLPDVFTVRGVIDGTFIEKEVKRADARDSQGFDLVNIPEKAPTVFLSNGTDIKALNLLSPVGKRVYPFPGFVDQEGAFSYFREGSTLTKRALNQASAVDEEISFHIPEDYDEVFFAGNRLLATNGHTFYDPAIQAVFGLQGESEAFSVGVFSVSKKFIAMDVGHRQIKVWSTYNGKLLNTITYPAKSDDGYCDTLSVNDDGIVSIFSKDDGVILIYSVDGQRKSSFKAPQGNFTLSTDRTRLYASGTSIEVYEPEQDAPTKIIRWGDGLTRFVLGTDSTQKTLFVQSYTSPNLSPIGIEVWDIDTGLLLKSYYFTTLDGIIPPGTLIQQAH